MFWVKVCFLPIRKVQKGNDVSQASDGHIYIIWPMLHQLLWLHATAFITICPPFTSVYSLDVHVVLIGNLITSLAYTKASR